MKLKRLVIRNIASIENADINFEEKPLCDEPVFLICGDTGAGKTTILDCICLALYNQTPRIQRTQKESYLEEGQTDKDDAKAILTNDCRQLMRRNTAEAWSELTYTGTDGVDYIARWYVNRGHKKVSGTIQPVKWSLESLGSNHTWTKNTEVKTEILRTIGLTFDQYCRTAMLAQGDFTLFLQSKENEKSEILEKLTGTEIYSRIGSTIFALTRNKKQQYEEQEKKIGQVHILPEEEKENIRQGIKKLQEEMQQAEKKKQELIQQQNWLKQKQDLEKQIRETENTWQQLQMKCQSEEFRKNEKAVALWSETGQLRHLNQQKETVSRQLEEVILTQGKWQKKYQTLYAKWLGFGQQLDLQKKNYRQLLTALEAQKELVPLLEQSQTICHQIEIWQKQKDKVSQNASVISALEKKQPLLEKGLQDKLQELTLCKQENEKQQKDLEQIRKQLNLTELEEMQREQKLLTADLELLTQAQQKILLLKERVTQKNQTEEEITKRQTALDEMATQTESYRQHAAAQQKSLQALEDVYSKQEMATSKWAKEVRSLLHEGDVCPVCGQKILEIRSEEQISSVLLPLKKQIEELKVKKETAEKLLMEHEEGIKAQQKMLQDLRKRQEKEMQNYKEIYLQTQEACRKCQIIEFKKNTQKDVDQRIEDIKKKQETIRQSVQNYQALNKKISRMQQEKDRQQSKLEKITEEKNSLEKDWQKTQSRLEEQKAMQQKELQEERRQQEEITRAVACLQDAGWQHQPQAFVQKLQHMAEQRQKDLEQEIQWRHDIQEKEQASARMANKNREAGRFLSVQDCPTNNPLMPDADLEQQWDTLVSAVTETATRKETLIRQQQSLEEEIHKFMEQHPEYEPALLKQVWSLSQDSVDMMKQQNQKLKDDTLLWHGKQEQAQKNYQKHLKEAPEQLNGVSSDEIQLLLDEKNRFTTEAGLNIGRWQAQLEEDQKQAKQLQQDIVLRDQLRDTYYQWDQLCKMFGDDKGTKFRNIAQSFVLLELLQRANFYLEKLTDRYELSCQPGSLTILLKDWYQGGVSRPASTLSGGESFLISLSLALGLSSLNRQSLSVDTLFIDEGFGTLSGDYLNIVMDTLERLHQIGGKKVGIISHVAGLRERIKTQIQVYKTQQSRSAIRIISTI